MRRAIGRASTSRTAISGSSGLTERRVKLRFEASGSSLPVDVYLTFEQAESLVRLVRAARNEPWRRR